MLAGVGQRLLDHPVGGQLGALRQRVRRALLGQRHRHARGPGLLDQLPELAEAGLGGQLGPGVAGAEQSEQPPHLGQGLPSGRRDGRQRPAGPFRVAVQRVSGAVGLDHHDADVVSDHVVQFPGDPGSLGRGGDLGLGVGLPLQPGRAFLQGRVVRTPVAHGVAEHPGDQRGPAEDHQGYGDLPVQVKAVRPGQHPDDRADQANPQPGQRYPPRPVGGQRVQQDRDGQVGPARARGGSELNRARHHRDAERGLRVPSSEGHRDDHGQQERQRDQDRAAVTECRARAQRGQQQRQQAVHQLRVTAQPGIDG